MKRNNYKLTAIFPLFILASCFSGVKAQTTYENLEKYWLYRDRLDKYFVLIDSDTEKPGTNHPFFFLDGKWATGETEVTTLYNVLSTGDGNDQMQYYIGMLATEYRLLQREHQDYTKTRNQLLYALKAIQRIDRNSESYFRKAKDDLSIIRVDDNRVISPINPFLYTAMNNGPVVDEPDVNPSDRYGGDLNGFMIRNDISAVFLEDNSTEYPFLNNYCNATGGLDGRWRTRLPQGMSKDNVWNYLINFALVKLLVDDEEIQNRVKEITVNMIKAMHFDLYDDIDDKWDIINPALKLAGEYWAITNPATGLFVDQGAVVEDVGLNGAVSSGLGYAFAEAAEFITGENLHYASSSLNKADFYRALNIFTTYKNKQAARYLILGTIMGNDKRYVDYTSFSAKKGTIMYETIRNIDKGQTMYEHLPLIRRLLVQHQIDRDNFENYKSKEAFNEEKNRLLNDVYLPLLNSAPICGPFNLYDTTSIYPQRSIDWSIENRLTQSHAIGEPLDSAAKYSHLGVFNGIDYMLLHNLVWLVYYDKDADRILHDSDIRGAYDHKSIISDQDIKVNEFADYKADYISLEDGFTVEPGGKFYASDRGNIPYSYINTKSIADANSCFAYRPFTNIDNPGSSGKAKDNICKILRVKSDVETINQEASFFDITQESVIHKPSTVYPNPTHSSLTVTHALSTKQISVFSNKGVLLQQIENKGLMSETTVDLSDYEAGVYYIQVDNGEYHKVVKE